MGVEHGFDVYPTLGPECQDLYEAFLEEVVQKYQQAIHPNTGKPLIQIVGSPGTQNAYIYFNVGEGPILPYNIDYFMRFESGLVDDNVTKYLKEVYLIARRFFPDNVQFWVSGASPSLIQVLDRIPNMRGGRRKATNGRQVVQGIHDYDLVYYDASDLSYEAEDVVIQAGKQLFADIPIEVEIRNQARVHLWYEKKFGLARPANKSVEDGIDSWISTSAMLGVRLEDNGEWIFYAPRGLSDFFNMVVRPNTAFAKRENYEKKVERWKAIWSGLKVEAWPENEST